MFQPVTPRVIGLRVPVLRGSGLPVDAGPVRDRVCDVAQTVQGVLLALLVAAVGATIAGWPTKWAREAVKDPAGGPIDWENLRWMVVHHRMLRASAVGFAVALGVVSVLVAILC